MNFPIQNLIPGKDHKWVLEEQVVVFVKGKIDWHIEVCRFTYCKYTKNYHLTNNHGYSVRCDFDVVKPENVDFVAKINEI